MPPSLRSTVYSLNIDHILARLRAQLKQLHLKPSVPIPNSSARATHKAHTIETLLTSFMKQGYLDRQKSSLGVGGGDASQRGKKRSAGDDDDGPGGGADFEWKWGSRSIAEINEEGVARFVRDFMGDRHREREEADAEEDIGPGKTEAQLKFEKAVMKDLARSAGGPLMTIKTRKFLDEEVADEAASE